MRTAAFLAAAPLLLVGAAGADDRAALKPLIDKAVKAAGGEKMTGLKAWTHAVRFQSPDGGTSIVRQFVQLPDLRRIEQESEVDGKKIVRVHVVAGDRGWRKEPDGTVKVMPDRAVPDFTRFLEATGFRQVLVLTDPGRTLSPLGESKVGDRTVVGVKVVRAKGHEERLYLDKESGRLVKVVSASKPQDGKEVLNEWSYEDFKEVDGIFLPYKRVHRRGGEVVTVAEVVEFEAADKLDPKLFEKP
jgi:hypothetical protein